MVDSKTIAASQAALFYGTVTKKHKTGLLNGYMLPSLGSSIVTNDYLDKASKNSQININ